MKSLLKIFLFLVLAGALIFTVLYLEHREGYRKGYADGYCAGLKVCINPPQDSVLLVKDRVYVLTLKDDSIVVWERSATFCLECKEMKFKGVVLPDSVKVKVRAKSKK